MTPRMFFAYAGIAGIGYTESLKMAPGFILDLFLTRRKYDCAMRGIRW